VVVVEVPMPQQPVLAGMVVFLEVVAVVVARWRTAARLAMVVPGRGARSS
jgi:hypothetical protein